MRRLPMLVLLVLFLMCSGGTVNSSCGNVDNRGGVDIADLAYLLNYLGAQAGGAPAPPNLTDANLDGRAGITISDATMLVHYLFGPYDIPSPPSLCSLSNNYTFEAATDSVFCPQVLNIPDGVDTVRMPIVTVFDTNTRGVYLPFLKAEPGTTHFILNRVEYAGNMLHGTTAIINLDTACAEWISADWPNLGMSGRQTIATLRFVRATPGMGSIVTTPVTRSNLWRPSVVKNEDLFVPTIGSFTYTFPPETLKVSPVTLNLTGAAGYPAIDSGVIKFWSSGLPVTFDLTSPDSWLTIVDPPPVGFMAGGTAVVKADATGLAVGDYSTTVQIANPNPPAPIPVSQVTINLHIREAHLYPPGDLDCDDGVDISDLSAMIDYLYILFTPLRMCPALANDIGRGSSLDASAHVSLPVPGDLDCDGIVDIGDLTALIDYLYISMRPLQACPR